MSTARQKEIYDAWEAHEDDDISTERLMQMVCDTCRCNAGDVANALEVVGLERGSVTIIEVKE